ncbi:hypothetical protein CS542_06720 [Pedobacter sp. IW39]|nr:hypothetical protein CS542_06720 [Pedobacter sp. IW39]
MIIRYGWAPAELKQHAQNERPGAGKDRKRFDEKLCDGCRVKAWWNKVLNRSFLNLIKQLLVIRYPQSTRQYRAGFWYNS